MKILKKLVSVLVASCFMLSVANLPAVANIYDNTNYEYGSGDYYTQTYTTPAQAAAKASSGSKKVKSTKKKTTKKKQSKKKVAKKVTAKAVNNLVKQNKNLVKKIKNIKGISKSAKKWLTEVTNSIKNIEKSKKSNAAKYSELQKILKSLKTIQKAKGSDLSIVEETVKSGSVFSANKFKNALKNSATYKIYKDFGKTIFKTFSKLSKVLKLSIETVKNVFFNKMGVQKGDMEKAAPLMLKLLNKGEDFINCASNAVSKFLGISKSLAALMNLAAEISINVTGFINKNKKEFSGTYTDASAKTLKINGYKNITYLKVSLDDIMDSKEGTKFMLRMDAYTYGKKNEKHDVGHIINVIKEKGNKFSVSDNLTNNGEYITYTAEEFKKFMQGKTAKGKTSTGKTITVYNKYDTTDGILKYKRLNDNNEASIITNLTDLQAKIYEKYDAEERAAIVNLSKKTNISIKTIYNYFVDKELYPIRTYDVIKKLAKKLNMNEKTICNKFIEKGLNRADVWGFFWGLDEFGKDKNCLALMYNYFVKGNSFKSGDYLSNSELMATTLLELVNISGLEGGAISMKIYEKYGEDGLLTIKGLADKLNISQETVYNMFVGLGVNKADMDLILESFEEYREKEDCIKFMYNNCINNNGVCVFGGDISDRNRIANVLKNLMELSNMELAA